MCFGYCTIYCIRYQEWAGSDDVYPNLHLSCDSRLFDTDFSPQSMETGQAAVLDHICSLPSLVYVLG
jgi:hypothetical protein